MTIKKIMHTYIYALNDPETGLCRYVGKANNPKLRFNGHMCARMKNVHKDNWIYSLKQKGLKPVMEILRKVPYEGWEVWEKAFIEEYRKWGFPLTNLVEGGEGLNNPSAETRKRMSEHQLGRKNHNFGRTPSLETRALLRASRLGKRASDETRKKISESKCELFKRFGEKHPRLGKKHSVETRLQMSISAKAKHARIKLQNQEVSSARG